LRRGKTTHIFEFVVLNAWLVVGCEHNAVCCWWRLESLSPKVLMAGAEYGSLSPPCYSFAHLATAIADVVGCAVFQGQSGQRRHHGTSSDVLDQGSFGRSQGHAKEMSKNECVSTSYFALSSHRSCGVLSRCLAGCVERVVPWTLAYPFRCSASVTAREGSHLLHELKSTSLLHVDAYCNIDWGRQPVTDSIASPSQIVLPPRLVTSRSDVGAPLH
jgi:hypothetical protein